MMKTADLVGPQLDFWTAKAIGLTPLRPDADPGADDYWAACVCQNKKGARWQYQPSQYWTKAGELVEHFRLTLTPTKTGWVAKGPDGARGTDAKPLVAIARCAVACVFGKTVKDTPHANMHIPGQDED